MNLYCEYCIKHLGKPCGIGDADVSYIKCAERDKIAVQAIRAVQFMEFSKMKKEQLADLVACEGVKYELRTPRPKKAVSKSGGKAKPVGKRGKS